MAKLYQFYRRLLHAKAFAEKGADYFFSNRTRSAIFQKPLLARSDKRQWNLHFFYFFFFCPLKEGGLSASCLA
jgi:hypothetical protein